MKVLGDFFSSSARTEILRALYHQPQEVGLRQLARIADVRVRSAELALDALVTEGFVRRRRASRRVFYWLERSHPGTSVLAAVFDAAATTAIRANRRSLDRRARRILPFIEQSLRMLEHARSRAGHGAALFRQVPHDA